MRSGQFETRYNKKTGKLGIVLGKYKQTKTDRKTVTEHNEVEVGGPDSAMYKDAIDLAKGSGLGYSVLDDGFYAGTDFSDMRNHYIAEDAPIAMKTSEVLASAEVPRVEEVGDLRLRRMLPNDFST